MTRVVLDLPDGMVSLLDSTEQNLAREFLVRFAVTLFGEGKVRIIGGARGGSNPSHFNGTDTRTPSHVFREKGKVSLAKKIVI